MQIFDRLRSFLSFPILKIGAPILLSGLIIYLLITGNLFQSGVRTERYPVGAVHFLKQHRLEGNMFNIELLGTVVGVDALRFFEVCPEHFLYLATDYSNN